MGGIAYTEDRETVNSPLIRGVVRFAWRLWMISYYFGEDVALWFVTFVVVPVLAPLQRFA